MEWLHVHVIGKAMVAPPAKRELNMNISIIGAGNMALGLAGILSQAGYSVVIGGRDPAKAIGVSSQFDANVQGGTVADAVRQSDIVILAVPYDAVAELVAEADGFAGKILVDITNPLTADYMGLTIGHATSAAEEIQKRAPGAKVVKAFNTLFAQVLQAGGRVGGQPASVFIAGDDEAANAAVGAIVSKAGLVPVQTGALKVARYLEPVAGLNIVLGYGRGHGAGIAPAWIFAPQSKAV